MYRFLKVRIKEEEILLEVKSLRKNFSLKKVFILKICRKRFSHKRDILTEYHIRNSYYTQKTML